MTPQLDAGTTRGIYVVQTYVIGREDYYEIQVAPEPGVAAPRVALITTNKRIYECALAAEDKSHCFDVAWHRVTTAFGVKYQIDQFEKRT